MLVQKSYATSPIRAYYSRRGVGPVDSIAAYRTAPWARALTDKIGDAMAASLMTLKLYDDGATANKEGTAGIPVKDHEFLRFIFNGCAEMSAYVAFATTYKIMHLTGACAWHITRNRLGKPLSYRPIPIDWVTGFDDNHFFDYDKPVVVTITYPDGTTYNAVNKKDIKIFFNRDPGNPYDYRGTSVIQALAGEFDTDTEAASALRHGYKNNLTPSMLVSLEDAEQEELESLYNGMSSNKGSAGHGSAFFTNSKVKVEQLQQSLGQTPIIEHRKFSRDNAIQVHGVPLEMLGVSENSNRAAAESAEYIFYRSTIIPKLEFFVSELRRMFLDAEFKSKDLILRYDNPLPDNEESKRLLMTARPDAFRKNEFREAAGLPPLSEEEGGLDFPISIDPYNPTPRDISNPEARKPDARGTGAGVDGQADKQFRFINKSLNPIDIENILQGIKFSDLAEKVDFVKWYKKLIAEIGEEAAKDVMQQAGIRFELHPSRQSVAEFMSRTMSMLEREVGDVFSRDMRNILLDAQHDGLGLKKTAKLIREKFGISGKRAERIARTELTRSSGFARQDAWEQSGAIKWKQWIHLSGSGKDARDRHKEMHKTVIPLGEKFKCRSFQHGSKFIEEDYATHPGEFSRLENNVNCRCSMKGWVIKPEESKAAELAANSEFIAKTIEQEDKFYKDGVRLFSEFVELYQEEVIRRLEDV